MTTEFSLRSLIREVRDELGTGDAHRIAKEASHRIAPADHESAFLQALAEVAREVVNSGHPKFAPAGGGAGQRNSARSSKVRAIRNAWPELRAVYACLDNDKQLGDYDAGDLIFVADHLDKVASQNAAKAARFRDLSGRLAEHDVSKVRDLPNAVLAEVFTGEAA